VLEDHKQAISFYLYIYNMNNILIQQTDHAKYLGVSIDKNLNRNENTQQVVSKANKVKEFLQHNLNKCSSDAIPPM